MLRGWGEWGKKRKEEGKREGGKRERTRGNGVYARSKGGRF